MNTVLNTSAPQKRTMVRETPCTWCPQSIYWHLTTGDVMNRDIPFPRGIFWQGDVYRLWQTATIMRSSAVPIWNVTEWYLVEEMLWTPVTQFSGLADLKRCHGANNKLRVHQHDSSAEKENMGSTLRKRFWPEPRNKCLHCERSECYEDAKKNMNYSTR